VPEFVGWVCPTVAERPEVVEPPEVINRPNRRDSDVSDMVYVADSEIHGKGLFAARDIKKNKVVGKLLGNPTRKDGTYVLWLTKKLGLRLTNDLRFINHGKKSKANCELTDTDVVTIRAVKKDEELLHDYGW